jgi:O-antigen ligase
MVDGNRSLGAAFALLPAALLLYLAFNSGGIFGLTTAFAVVLVLAATAICVVLAPFPLAGLSPRGILVIALLALLALWALVSGTWSEAGARADAASVRILLYLAVLVLFACSSRSEGRLRWLLRGLLLATAVVALSGLLSRLAPGLWPTEPGLVNDRLSYPITYWNTFALLVGFALILAFHHASDEREPALARIGAAALLPALAAALLLTFSRGALAVTLVGLVVYAIAARPRGLAAAVLAIAAPTAVALLATHGADLVQQGTPLGPAALSQAHQLAWVLAGCTLAAAILRALGLKLDARLSEMRISRRASRRAWAGAAGLALVAVAIFLLVGGGSTLHRQYERFVGGAPVVTGADQSSRLLDLGNDGRKPLWEVAEEAFSAQPLKGTGAGTFQLEWQRADGRPDRVFAYSLYLETMAELGLVGLLLLVAAIAMLLLCAASLIRGPARAPAAAAFAVIVAWALRAGLDIDWQTPAVCVPVFALGGLALARGAEPAGGWGGSPPRPAWLQRAVDLSEAWLRPALVAACLALMVPAARWAIGQSDTTEAVAALASRNCASAHGSAADAISAAGAGPRPYEVLAMCAGRQGDPGFAVSWAERAVTHDPHAWEPRYVLALARASAGLDPRPQAAAALALNPSRDLLRIARRALSGSSPRDWRRAGRTLPLALE